MRLGVIGSRNLDEPARIATELGRRRSDDPALIIVASTEGEGVGRYALDWAADAGVGYEDVPAAKVGALSDRIIAFGDDAELEQAARRAASAGVPVERIPDVSAGRALEVEVG